MYRAFNFALLIWFLSASASVDGAATGDRNDPHGSFNFIVEIDGLGEVAGFLSVEGLETTSDVIIYRNGDEDITPRKIPGKKRFANIVLRRGVTANADLWEWRKSVLDGKTERKGGAIVIRNEAREEAIRFTFREAWPCRYSIGKLDATQNGIAIEEIELVVEDLTRE